MVRYKVRVMLDAAIIGAGPAGAAAALSLRQLMPSAAIAIFDAGGGGRWRPGEVLSPGAMPILQSLGCWHAFQESGFIESCGTRAAWSSPETHQNEFLFSMHGNAWRLNRARFEQMLLKCVQAAGVEVHCGTSLVDSNAVEGGWRLQFHRFECQARFVIDASGRAAVFAVQRGARRLPDDRLAAVVMLFQMEDDADPLVEATENGWWYSATVPGATVVAAFMTDTDYIRRFRLYKPEIWSALLAKSKHTRERLREALPKGPPAVFTAHSQHLSHSGGPGWVAAGDAAMTFDPLSSQGIRKALRSGKLASFAAVDLLLHKSDTHQKYEDLAAAEYNAYQETKSGYYEMEQRWPESEFWKRRRRQQVTAT
jgi:flavin-dependent dehydrogenase